MFKDSFEQSDPINDANNVAVKIVKLVESAQPRPIRTQVGQDMDVEAVNAAVEPIQSGLLTGPRAFYTGGWVDDETDP